MRILGYLDHPILKITVFKTDTRLSIKFENSNFEQTYKFRPTEQTNSLKELQKLVDETFVNQVMTLFQQMEQNFEVSFQRNFPEAEDDDFPAII
ncbi:hypothetical protein [Lewinella sp. LCG006]|uniref:hypothetical protein n=1 Tax=Lewinella sp. LCG006 TaxID=3231911 RepID=UPI003460F858